MRIHDVPFWTDQSYMQTSCFQLWNQRFDSTRIVQSVKWSPGYAAGPRLVPASDLRSSCTSRSPLGPTQSRFYTTGIESSFMPN